MEKLTNATVVQWSETEHRLWSRIQQHSFESPLDGFDFLRRLRREQRWGKSYALRVIEEYRRFFFLLATRKLSLTPSEAVDQVWHLHLTYSRDYWDVWCKEILQMPVHHGPTRGGAKQAITYGSQYAQTLALYCNYFGDIPEDLWPSSRKRFANAGRWRWVDESQFHVFRRPRFSRLALPLCLLGLSLMLFTPLSIASIANPFDWPAKPFLVLYGLGVLTGLYLLILYRFGKTSASASARLKTALTPLETACLVDESRMVYTAIVDSLQSDVVRFSINDCRLVKGQAPPQPHQKAVALVAQDNGTLEKANDQLQPLFDHTRQMLEKRRLLYSKNEAKERRLLLFSLVLVWLAFGIIRLFIGESRNEPTGYLMLMTMAQGITVVFILTMPIRLTSAGEWALTVTRQTCKRVTLAPRLDSGELAMAVALVGTSALIATPFAEFHDAVLDRNGGMTAVGGGGASGEGGCGGGGCGGCGG